MKKQYVAHTPHRPGQGSFVAPVPIYGQVSASDSEIDFNVAVPFKYYKLAAVSIYVRAFSGFILANVGARDINSGATSGQIASTNTELGLDKLLVFHADADLAGAFTVGSADFAVSASQQLTFPDGNIFSTVADTDLGNNSGKIPRVYTVGIGTGESATLDIWAWIIPVSRF